MVEFGEDFIIESYRIPWLVWIQLAVMILLVILLYFGFAVVNSNPSTLTFATASSSDPAAAASPARLNRPSSSHNPRRTNMEDHQVRTGPETCGASAREGEIEDQSSLKESTFLKIFKSSNHPCNYFGLFRQAFLKCLGLDSSSERSRDQPHDKQE